MIWKKMKNIVTADLHLRPPKIPTEVKTGRNGPQRTKD